MLSIRTTVLVSFIFSALASCAQGKYGIKKIHSFYRQHYPGTIQATGEGGVVSPVPDTVHLVYIETKGQKADWEIAWWHDKTYNVNLVKVPENSTTAGTEIGTGKPVRVIAGKGNQLWELRFISEVEQKRPPFPLKKEEIILQGKYGTKTVTRVIKSSKQLQIIPSV